MAGTISPEALHAVISAAAKTPPPGAAAGGADPSQQGGGGASVDPTQAGGDPNSQMPQDPNAQGGPTQDGGNATEQAVWSEFPSTDPQAIQQMITQAQGATPEQLLQMMAGIFQQGEADQDKLHQMQAAMVDHFIELLHAAAPQDGGQPADQSGVAGGAPTAPGVGGMGSGY